MFLGCDPDELRRFAAQLATMSTALDGSREALARGIAAVEWDGDDADRLRDDVARDMLPRFVDLAQALRQAGAGAAAEAEQQEVASAAEGDGAPARLAVAGDAVASGAGGAVASDDAAPVRTMLTGIRGIGWGAFDAGPESDALGPIPPGPSRGMLRDWLGETYGPRAEQAWLDVTDYGAAASAKAGPVPAVGAIAVDFANGQMAQYEMLNGLRDGDSTAIADGLVTAHLASTDLLFNALELTPFAPAGVVGSHVTAPLLEGWNGLRRDALADEDAGGDSQGSPVRYMMQAPVRYDEETIQPWAEAHPGVLGDAVGETGDGIARIERTVEQTQDDTVAWTRDQFYRLPGAEEALALPRHLGDTSRKLTEELLGE